MNFITHTLEPGKLYSQKALSVLEIALKDPVHSATIVKELTPLLLPGNTASSQGELIKVIRSAAGFHKAGKNE
jgi:hypothetical protein